MEKILNYVKKAAKNRKVQTAVIATATFIAGGVADRMMSKKKDKK